VPSSLDRKSKSKEFEGEPASQHSSNNNNLSKYWPLGRNRDTRHAPATKSVSSERLQVKEQFFCLCLTVSVSHEKYLAFLMIRMFSSSRPV
jgi:hypothetical protein